MLPTTAVTWAPVWAAIWIASMPTPPAAPVINTRRPASAPPSRTQRNAVIPATGKVQACAKLTLSGSGTIRCAATAACSAQPNSSVRQTTRVPAGGPAPFAACFSTIPAMSWPGIQPSPLLTTDRNSPRFSENAWTATRASCAAGTGSGMSRISTGARSFSVVTRARMSHLRQSVAREEAARVVFENGGYLVIGQSAGAQHRQKIGENIAVRRRPFPLRAQTVDMRLFPGG